MSDMLHEIDQMVKDQPVVLFMKGTRDFPMCGFSARVAHMLNTLGVDYRDVNVLEDDGLRQGIKTYTNWPTIPQLYINGKFVGGCDIAVEMYQSGELQALVEQRA
jgi:monothiol glutaredoxin